MSRRARKGRQNDAVRSVTRKVNYRNLRNTLQFQPAFSEDQIEDIHNTALRVNEELGIKVLNEEARQLFKEAGAEVHEDIWMVHIQKELIENALKTAPSIFQLHGARETDTVTLGGDHINFVCVGGAPHIADIDRGKRPATLEDTRNIIKLCEHFDVIHFQSPNVESQDIPVHLRHLHVTEAQVTLSGKPHFIFSRGIQICPKNFFLKIGLGQI